MVSREYFEHERKVHHMAAQKRRAKLTGKLDHWGMPEVPKGWLRGEAWDIQQWDQPCPYGMLQIMEFELRPDHKTPGVKVRMNGTYLDNRLMDGQVMDVPDPDPSKRPIEPVSIIFPWTRYSGERIYRMTAFYPGRQDESLTRSRWLGMLALALPALGLAVAVVLLRYVYHVLD